MQAQPPHNPTVSHRLAAVNWLGTLISALPPAMRTLSLLLTIVIATTWIQDAARRRSGSGRRVYLSQTHGTPNPDHYRRHLPEA